MLVHIFQTFLKLKSWSTTLQP